MFGIFKSKETKTKEILVEATGMELFDQFSRIRDNDFTNKPDANTIDVRINSFFSAGYIVGFIESCLKEYLSENELDKYTKEIISGIFPSAGVKMVYGRIGMTKNDLGVDEFESGYSAGWEDAEGYKIDYRKSEKLFNYVCTGKY